MPELWRMEDSDPRGKVSRQGPRWAGMPLETPALGTPMPSHPHSHFFLHSHFFFITCLLPRPPGECPLCTLQSWAQISSTGGVPSALFVMMLSPDVVFFIFTQLFPRTGVHYRHLNIC